jgi:predicted GNAT family acetyltransferase
MPDTERGETVTDQVRDNHERNRFELVIDGETAFADYQRDGNVVSITWVEAPPRLRGTGAADRLMRGIVDLANANGWDIAPKCRYAEAWFRAMNGAKH